MIKKIMLCLMVGFIFSISSTAQNNSESRKEYENWKQNILPTMGKKNLNQPHIYISAKVQRLDARSGEIKLALAQQNSSFKVEIQPLESEKTMDGNMIFKQAGEKATVSTYSSDLSISESKIHYSEPSITFLTPATANAVEVILYDSTTKTTNKLVLPFNEQLSTGVLTSVGN